MAEILTGYVLCPLWDLFVTLLTLLALLLSVLLVLLLGLNDVDLRSCCWLHETRRHEHKSRCNN